MNRVQQVILLSFVALVLVFSYTFYLRRTDTFTTQIPYLRANTNFQNQKEVDDKSLDYNGTVTPWSLIFSGDIPLERADDFPLTNEEAESLQCPDKYVIFNAMAGYNNQIITTINALFFARALGRTLVIPDIHTDSENTGETFTYKEFSDYFNMKLWQRTGVCVITRREFLAKFTEPPPVKIQYQFVFGYTPSVSGHVDESFRKHYNASKMELTEIFIDEKMLEDDIKKYFSENPSSSPPGAAQDLIYISSPLGIVNFPKAPHMFWHFYTAIFQSFHQRIFDAADLFIQSKEGLLGSSYVAVHYRRMPIWAHHCHWFANDKEGDYSHCYPNVEEALQRIKRFLRKNERAESMFLSTNANELEELEKIQEEFRPKILYPKDLGELILEAKRNGKSSIDRKPSDLLGLKLDTNEKLFVDMMICAKANAFLANKWSTLSGFVQYQRLIFGKDPSTTHWW